MEEDKAIIKFFVQCFDRPAFQDDIYQEGRMEDFDKAIEDTLIALNTGVMRTRDGEKLKQAEGKSAIQNPIWRKKLDTIADMLNDIRRRRWLKQSIHIQNMVQDRMFFIVFQIENSVSGLILQEKKY